MEFNSKTHKVLVETLNREEAIEYVEFLQKDGVDRHSHEAEIALRISMINPSSVCARLYFSAYIRHLDDIEASRKLITEVKEKFNI